MHSWVASWLFNPSLAHNTAATSSTYVAFVGGRCRRVRDALALPQDEDWLTGDALPLTVMHVPSQARIISCM